ncbi:MAG: VCBS repeat-containing protein [Gammaproteobacteria bacterium]|nr:VCBS repeat-containing protein [Gammaproteobacteria bacterium]
MTTIMPRLCLSLVIAALISLAPLQPGYGQETERGRELAATVCASCHLLPGPDILTRQSWDIALTYMGLLLGIDDTARFDDAPPYVRTFVNGRKKLLGQDGVLPAGPLIVERDWQAIRAWYLASAPEVALPQTGKPPLVWSLPQFRIRESDYVSRPAVTTLVRINPAAHEVIIGDTDKRSLAVLGADGRLKGEPRIFGPAMMPVDIEFRPEGALVASIGDLYASLKSEDRPGLVARISGYTGGPIESGMSVLINRLHRMADMELADINDDGVEDFIISGFGANFGSLSWFESQPGGGFAAHLLIDRPGAVRTQAFDFNDDGFLDIAVLMSHAREGFYILLNDGHNAFTPRTVFETQPAYGHTWFELHDFNGDGRMDFMTVNGDNVDSDPYNTLRNYNGLRIFLNEGELRFREAYFYPMYGAFGARAADFDNDGDLDIAAVAFYPDFEAERPESFVYLQNNGNLHFEAHSAEALSRGRWVTIDAGDIDGDGDADIVLGGGTVQLGMANDRDRWRELVLHAPSVLLLENVGTGE